MVYAISDFHLSFDGSKPMDIFGENWSGHWEKIIANVNAVVKPCDILVVAGDLSWSMKLESAKEELEAIVNKLNGHKVFVRGNHDYWWSSLSKAQAIVGEKAMLLQCNAVRLDGHVFVGSRGWDIITDEKDKDNLKIYKRELLRLEQSMTVADRIKQDGDDIIGVMHFPPFSPGFLPSGFTELFENYGVKKVIYGHIHGKDAISMPKVVTINEVQYYLTSCDALDFMPIRIV